MKPGDPTPTLGSILRDFGETHATTPAPSSPPPPSPLPASICGCPDWGLVELCPRYGAGTRRTDRRPNAPPP
eukprot:6926204-Prymnesium_polylepis.1